MADLEEIERWIAGILQAAYLDREAAPQRAGVLASLNLIADSLDLLSRKEEARIGSARTSASSIRLL